MLVSRLPRPVHTSTHSRRPCCEAAKCLRRLRHSHRPAVLARLAQGADDRRSTNASGAASEDSGSASGTARSRKSADRARASQLSQSLWLRNTVEWTANSLRAVDLCRAR